MALVVIFQNLPCLYHGCKVMFLTEPSNSWSSNIPRLIWRQTKPAPCYHSNAVESGSQWVSIQSHRLAPPPLPQAGRQPAPGLALLDEKAWPGQWLGGNDKNLSLFLRDPMQGKLVVLNADGISASFFSSSRPPGPLSRPTQWWWTAPSSSSLVASLPLQTSPLHTYPRGMQRDIRMANMG